MLTTVRFIKSYGAYNAGVEAGFQECTAAALIKSGNAVLVHRPSDVQKDATSAPAGSGTKGSVRK